MLQNMTAIRGACLAALVFAACYVVYVQHLVTLQDLMAPFEKR